MWMVEVDEKAILNHIIDSYDVFASIIDNILDTVDTHDAVKNLLLDLINTIILLY